MDAERSHQAMECSEYYDSPRNDSLSNTRPSDCAAQCYNHHQSLKGKKRHFPKRMRAIMTTATGHQLIWLRNKMETLI